jgi:recombination protein RecR
MARSHLASAFDRLLEQLARLPGIGNRSAQRIAFHLLKAPESDAADLADALTAFRKGLKVCSICGHVSEADPCPICNDGRRDRSVILVVEQPSDVASLEQTGSYRGLYHVLMGRLAPLDGIGPGELNIAGLLSRVKGSGQAGGSEVREVVLGTNPTLEGDGTALYLADHLGAMGVAVTRLARGMPTGSNLAMVSKAVLADAIQGRQTMKRP